MAIGVCVIEVSFYDADGFKTGSIDSAVMLDDLVMQMYPGIPDVGRRCTAFFQLPYKEVYINDPNSQAGKRVRKFDKAVKSMKIRLTENKETIKLFEYTMHDYYARANNE